ncbi:unnamed protein product [Victoria cruziana]
MRDFGACFSENAVQVSEVSCSPHISSPSPSPSIQNMVTCFYLAEICGQSRLVAVSWCKNLMGQGLSVNLDDNPSSSHCACKIDMRSWFFWKKRGSKAFEAGTSTIEVHWDLFSAKYGPGPEPIKGFFVAVVADRRLILLLGDMPEEARTRTDPMGPLPDPVLVSRREHVSGKSLYTTKAQFSGYGRPHDIVIECRDQIGEFKEPRLSVRIDKKMVVHVKRLLWKFRGNQTIVVDGLHVDMLWDVHDWFFNPASGHAVFMFKTRETDSKSWTSASSPSSSSACIVNKLHTQEPEPESSFSLFIYAWKNQ